MKKILVYVLLICACGAADKNRDKNKQTIIQDERLLIYEIDLKNSELNFYLKDDKDKHFKNFERLKEWLNEQNKQLKFAMNGGMYNKDLSPQGLYIEQGKEIKKIDTQKEGYGNFYLQPNGIFYITHSREAQVVSTEHFKPSSTIKYATQSGPMLIINGVIHPKFRKGSTNIHIRNGVGVLPNGNVLFAMSKEKINFYDFANFFKINNCKNAVYLDGFVSRTYLPSKNWIQEDGNFGVMIGEVE